MWGEGWCVYVCICVCMCTCVYIHMYIHVYTHVHMCPCTYSSKPSSPPPNQVYNTASRVLKQNTTLKSLNLKHCSMNLESACVQPPPSPPPPQPLDLNMTRARKNFARAKISHAQKIRAQNFRALLSVKLCTRVSCKNAIAST